MRFVIHGTRDEIVPVWHGQASELMSLMSHHKSFLVLLFVLQALHEMCVKKGIAYEAYVVEVLKLFTCMILKHSPPPRTVHKLLQGGDHNNLEMQDSMLWVLSSKCCSRSSQSLHLHSIPELVLG